MKKIRPGDVIRSLIKADADINGDGVVIAVWHNPRTNFKDNYNGWFSNNNVTVMFPGGLFVNLPYEYAMFYNEVVWSYIPVQNTSRHDNAIECPDDDTHTSTDIAEDDGN